MSELTEDVFKKANEEWRVLDSRSAAEEKIIQLTEKLEELEGANSVLGRIKNAQEILGMGGQVFLSTLDPKTRKQLEPLANVTGALTSGVMKILNMHFEGVVKNQNLIKTQNALTGEVAKLDRGGPPPI